MNNERLEDVAAKYTVRWGEPFKQPFKDGAHWHESEMMRQGLLIKLVEGPADGKVMPRPTVGHQITFRQTKDDGTIIDDTYVAEIDGVWRWRPE